MKISKKTLSYLKIFVLLLHVSVFIGCPPPTENPVGSISGTIFLENETDHSEITVAVYDFAELDATIKNINEEYPHIGVIINQQTQFDHRFQSPIKYTETNGNGNFKINDLSMGTYNIVALKDSFGFRYIYDVQVLEGSISIDTLSLYPETHLSGTIFVDIIFERDHHYIIDDDTDIFNTNVEIQPNTIIRISPDNSLKLISCEVKAQGLEDSLFWITSNDGFSEFPVRNINSYINPYYNFELSQNSIVEDNKIEWGKFDFADIGFQATIDSIIISSLIFRNSNIGFYSLNVSSTFCENILCNDVIEESNNAINFYNVDDGYIKKSIFINCYIGAKIYQRFEGLIENNYFMNNIIGLDLLHFIGLIKNNNLFNINKDVNFAGNYAHDYGIMDIFFNVFNAQKGVCQYDLHQYNYYPTININNNNFFDNDFFIIYLSTAYADDIDATNNYFNGIPNEDEIYEKIYDLAENYSPEVIISPFIFSNPISDAGIIKE